ncbi:MAG: hypothetical protein QOJ61_3882, partial [Mycobacterium sp.]|nr:hypothetical protein [Mycobacterium sp.]
MRRSQLPARRSAQVGHGLFGAAADLGPPNVR